LEVKVSQLTLTFHATDDTGSVTMQASGSSSGKGTLSQLVGAKKPFKAIKSGTSFSDQCSISKEWSLTTSPPNLYAHVAATKVGSIGFVSGSVLISVRGAGNF